MIDSQSLNSKYYMNFICKLVLEIIEPFGRRRGIRTSLRRSFGCALILKTVPTTVVIILFAHWFYSVTVFYIHSNNGNFESFRAFSKIERITKLVSGVRVHFHSNNASVK